MRCVFTVTVSAICKRRPTAGPSDLYVTRDLTSNGMKGASWRASSPSPLPPLTPLTPLIVAANDVVCGAASDR